MRRAACGAVTPAIAPLTSPAPAPSSLHKHNKTLENKELLRQQLLSTSKERAEKAEPPKPKQQRNRQKNRWKLKFHHQALPQEYLDHYEQSLQKTTAKAVQQKQKPAEKAKNEPNLELNTIPKETLKIWAQRLADIQNETGTLIQAPTFSSMANKSCKIDEKKKRNPAIAPSKIVTYDDLPYMGEMTLNNSKPRRGRKPKKADICHLIYENYGTVIPGQPTPIQDKLSQLNLCSPLRVNTPVNTPKTDLQNKIITSLLERKLLQENKRRQENISPPRYPNPGGPMPAAPITVAGPLHSDDEPLNLCIRDLTDLKIQIQKKFGNIYSSMPEIKTEVDVDNAKSESITSEQPNAISVIQRNTNLASAMLHSSPELSRTGVLSPALSEPAAHTHSPDKTAGCVYWPGAGTAGLYVHPLTLHTQLLYYQRLAAASHLPLSPEHERLLSTPNSATYESTSTEPNSPSIDDGKNKLVLKQISELLDPKIIKQTEDSKRSPDHAKMKRSSPNPTLGPVKRKRSAIFIPPMPVKSNSTIPTTEVSICKFKFTGGSKPSLQEKKMLSVDSGGNFRYYSGTGNKSNKGYEYLQKDSQCRNPQAMAMDTTTSTTSKADDHILPLTKDELSKRKRKSRKSLQREKLEQTFKEKGFLIQTQQLQSAEGATYCKFRQLRKFTRYLFRSWKDYLPGELDERGVSVGAGAGVRARAREGSADQQLPAASDEPLSAEWG